MGDESLTDAMIRIRHEIRKYLDDHQDMQERLPQIIAKMEAAWKEAVSENGVDK